MLLNYIKLSFRLLLRSPFLSLINLSCLSIGFAAFYILWPYAQSELNSDKFHKDYENIARLVWHHRWTDNKQEWDEFHHALNFCGIGKRIADEFSEVNDLTRLVLQKDFNKSLQGVDRNVFFAVYRSDSTKVFFREENTAFAEPNFFEFFSFPLQSGDATTVLSQPGSVVISRQHCLKYFGNRNPINSILYLNDSIPLRVTGILKDLPRNTHFKFDLLITISGMDGIDSRFTFDHTPDWIGANFIKVNKGVRFEDLERKIDDRRKELYGHWTNTDPTVFVQPLKDIVFTDFIDNPFIYKSKNSLVILRALSIIILFLAWTNYVSLSITTLHKRLPEVATRKVAGARNRDFLVQFFVESALINFLSILLAFTLVQLVKAPAEYLFYFYIPDWKTIVDEHLLILIVMSVMGITVTGVYPALISSQKGAADLLKKLRTVQMPWWIKSMVTLQYSSAVVLLIWIGTAYFQLNYILTKDTGINQEGVLVVDCPYDIRDDYSNRLDYFIDKSLAINGIFKASLSKSVMGDETGVPFFAKRNEDGIEVGLFSNGVVDEYFLDLYNIQLLAGRNFQANRPADKKSVLISSIAAARLGFSGPEECIGARIILPGYDIHNAEIIGVYKEYEFEPYYAEAQQKGHGSILTYKNSLASDIAPSKISFKVNLNEVASMIARLEELYKATFPLETFKWAFLDQNISQHYAQERVVRNQIMLFTLIAIGIACLGLLGDTSNKAIEKTKEIGIRKVLGAKMHQIAQIILNTTARQVIIANIIGIPAAYYLVEKYLERYSERVSFQWWHYALPLLLLLIIMLSTVASVVWRAARSNPVDALKCE